MTFDPTKPVQTRDGRKAEILGTDFKSDYPIAAVVTHRCGTQTVNSYTRDGHYYANKTPCSHDLINVPQKHKWWLNAYEGSDRIPGAGGIFTSREAADKSAKRDFGKRIACIEIEFTEGEGLDP